MLRDFKILNPGESRNIKKILSDMAKTGGGAPGTRWKGNLMEFKCAYIQKV